MNKDKRKTLDMGVNKASSYFFCPSYGILNNEHFQNIEQKCRQFAKLLGHTAVVEDPTLAIRGAQHWSHGAESAYIDRVLAHDFICPIRGGYGSINWAGALLDRTCDTPPYLVGYSDISIWHALWNVNNWGESCYGIMPGSSGASRGQQTLIQCIQGGEWTAETAACASIATGNAEGPLQAYCLRILSSLCGTPFMPTLKGCILALEDIDEKPYSVDRDLQQLHHSGCLDGVQALIFGQFPCASNEDEDSYVGPSHQDVFSQWSQILQIPVLAGLPFGHHPDPICLPCDRLCRLEVSQDQSTLSFAARSPS